ncbi:MAG: chemotaxis protein CheB [Proteobacteria bacterium]|nr:chemotaxis protein CheB [Pseudomonadota bacterium]MBU1232592.1 chemotaxis protein CheB [Pseudomonadota bacterium]MBU1417049.1 chemotaxis protein CheB [Pseudomonadota bacterium]MBU1453745.1 chemotaxis protein CheB [Pseudomonadota bacterium]
MTQHNYSDSPVKLLIVDDSWVLRRVLRETLSQRNDIEIVGEAANGIEALSVILQVDPDVILLDVEMPIMDGMTTLQHLMIHTPTPTIMLSSLSKKGSARCFDALKYGAVDFISKNCFFKGMDMADQGQFVVEKIFAAAHTTVHSIDPMQQGSGSGALTKIAVKVVFCEDCGTRHIIHNSVQTGTSVKCNNCGDDISLVADKRFRRVNFVTVIGCGEGGYANLLKIIPELNPEIGGALLVVILDEVEHVESFVKYLDAICDFKVSLAQDGLTLEGGGCYIFSGIEHVELSPYSGNYTLQMEVTPMSGNSGGIDNLMIAASRTLKNRVAGLLLSGAEDDGSKGMEEILKNNGTCWILNPDHCLQKAITSRAFIKYNLPGDLDENAVVTRIRDLHSSYQENVITA